MEAKMEPKKMNLHMDNLFNGDKQLGESTSDWVFPSAARPANYTT